MSFIFCVDSDGCAFDNMRWKHEHAFLPAFVEVWRLGAWEPIVAEHWYRINLYSETRGINRFAAFADCLSALSSEKDEALKLHLPQSVDELSGFLCREENRNVEAIRDYSRKANDPEAFQKALEWSGQVDRLVSELHPPLNVFPEAKNALNRMSEIGEIHVVSQAPNKTLSEEWGKAGIKDFTTRILGQEFGSKCEQIQTARNGRDLPTIMIGDAPGDERSAKEANVRFFLIEPRKENVSWTRLAKLMEDSLELGDQG